MATARIGSCLAMLLMAASLAQGQGRQGQGRQGQGRQAPDPQPEGRSLVDWYFFDASNVDAPAGRMVSVPAVAHRRSFTFDDPKTAPFDIDRADGRCFHRGTGTDGTCTSTEGCLYAARELQQWGRTQMCFTDGLVCCPNTNMDNHGDFMSPSWDPYTFQYFPSCGHHQHQQLHDQQHQQLHQHQQIHQHQQLHQQQQHQQQLHHHHQQHYNPAPPMPTRPSGAPLQGFEHLIANLFEEQAPQQAPQQPMPAPTRPVLPPVHHAPPVQPMEPSMMPVMEPPMMPVMKPAMKPMPRPPMMTTPRPPMKKPEPLVPLIEEANDNGTPVGRQPGDVARQKCVEYERFAPTVRFGPNNECIPNHTYPIGGNPALPREFPHFAQLGSGNRGDIEWFCGGALIAPSWILTAAHCLYTGSRKVQWVRLGDLEPESDVDDSNPQIIPVAQAVRHPEYRVPEVYNDIALLRLAREPDMSTPHVRPSCLQVDYKLKNDKLYLIGFGLTEENGDPAKALMEVNIWRTPGDKCKAFFGGPVNLRQLPDGLRDESQLCAGLDQVGKDACQGDSGGPLNTAYSPTCMHSITGVTSFGQGCGRGAPGVYTRVSHFVPWIERIVWPEEFQQ